MKKANITIKLLLAVSVTLICAFLLVGSLIIDVAKRNKDELVGHLLDGIKMENEVMMDTLRDEFASTSKTQEQKNIEIKEIVIRLHEENQQSKIKSLAVKVYPLIQYFDFDAAISETKTFKFENENILWLFLQTNESIDSNENIEYGQKSNNQDHVKQYSWKNPEGELFLKIMMQVSSEKLKTLIDDISNTLNESNLKTVDILVAAGNKTVQNSENQAVLFGEKASMKLMQRILIYLSVVLVGVCVILWIFTKRSVVRPLRRIIEILSRTADDMSDFSNKLATNSEKLASGATQQATNLEETASSMEQISGQTQDNASSAATSAEAVKDVAVMATQTAQSAQTATRLSNSARISAEGGAAAMSDIATAMKDIQRGSEHISNIIATINEITHRTKMLATNAAIEAARAGDHGKGFAVVADEVSKLAENSKMAAKEIEKLIKQGNGRAETGSELAAKGEQTINDILEKSNLVAAIVEEISGYSGEQASKIEHVKNLIHGIKSASTEQSSGVQQISKALLELDSLTQSNAVTAEQTSNSSLELSKHASILQNLIHDVSVEVGLKDGENFNLHSTENQSIHQNKNSGTILIKHEEKTKPDDVSYF